MKIQFPNPQDFIGRENLFFDQLELSVYHAKKAWEKTKKSYESDNEDQPWLRFESGIECITVVDDLLNKEDGDYVLRNSVSLKIEEL